MSAFSRGLFLRGQCLPNNTHFFLPSRIPARHLTTTSILRAITKTKAPPMKKAVLQSIPKNLSRAKPSLTLPSTTTPASSSAVYQTYATLLSQKPHPTLLYTAPSHTGFMMFSYLTASFCFAYATYHSWATYLHPPEDLSTWIPIFFAGVCVFTAAAGGYFALGPAWIVKSITAMPASALKAAGIPVKAAPGELKIEIELRKMLPLPFFPARKMYVRPGEIRLRHVLAAPQIKSKQLSASELRAARLQEEIDKKAALEYEQTHIMSRPFREIGRGASKVSYGIFEVAKRAWTREGFTGIYIKGKAYKLDVSGGWALDGGRALDRLVTIKLES